ncbi:hypothetical protein Tsubulata_027153 [Turnera subulata]|uniref:Phytocyanin domain-containing protein n=1 Tax=Turnera subulata TaxID=218843 RepID=A0A9Q0J8T6_9ROSI|nr:hypothetical protein Tsubulata_027153 [Turnera subulata]
MGFSRVLVPFLPMIILLLASSEASREIIVGSHQVSWKIPESPNKTLNHWAEQTRFKVGDVLVWKYDAKVDSVLEVTQQDYNGCNTTNPIKEHKDRNTKVELVHSGPFYFISGAQGSCEKGEKLEVVVLSPNHWKNNNSSDTTPLPSPAPAPRPKKGDAHGLKAGILGAFMGLGIWILM